MSALLELAERCEKATGPDNSLDEAIHLAIGFTYEDEDEGDGHTIRWWSPPHNPNDQSSCVYNVGAYTSSLDAALTLVPEGWDPQICKGPMFCLSANDTRPWGVSLIGNAREIAEEFGPEMAYDSHDANAATAPLAICAAALKARAASAIEAATADETGTGSAVGESAAPGGGDAPPFYPIVGDQRP